MKIPQNLIHALPHPDIYKLIFYLGEKSNIKHIIDFYSNDKNKLIGNPNFQITHLHAGREILNREKEFFNNSLVAFMDLDTRLLKSHSFLKYVSNISHYAKFSLISFHPDKTNNTCEYYEKLLRKYHFSDCFVGYTANSNVDLQKKSTLIIGGLLLNPKTKRKSRSILALMQIYNEKDIIQQTVTNLLDQGIDVKIYDNWSNDGTYELIKRLMKKYKGLSCVRFPYEGPNNKFILKPFLIEVEDLVGKTHYDWIIYKGADDILESPWTSLNLKQGIELVDSLGFNAIDLTIIEFFPTRDGFTEAHDPESFFHHFNFGIHPGHFLLIMLWKNIKKGSVNISSSGGHEVIFKDRRVFPIKFLLKHYSFRSSSQGYDKLFKNRINRLDEHEVRGGLHTHYYDYLNNPDINDQFLWDRKKLLKFNKNCFNKEYLVERISGISVIKDSRLTPYKEYFDRTRPLMNELSSIKKSADYVNADRYREELNRIKGSKFFKIWQLYCSVKNSIKSFIR